MNGILRNWESLCDIRPDRPLSCNAETKDFARPTSHPVRGWTGKNKAFCSPGTQTGGCVIKVYCHHHFDTSGTSNAMFDELAEGL